MATNTMFKIGAIVRPSVYNPSSWACQDDFEEAAKYDYKIVSINNDESWGLHYRLKPISSECPFEKIELRHDRIELSVDADDAQMKLLKQIVKQNEEILKLLKKEQKPPALLDKNESEVKILPPASTVYVNRDKRRRAARYFIEGYEGDNLTLRAEDSEKRLTMKLEAFKRNYKQVENT